MLFHIAENLKGFCDFTNYDLDHFTSVCILCFICCSQPCKVKVPVSFICLTSLHFSCCCIFSNLLRDFRDLEQDFRDRLTALRSQSEQESEALLQQVERERSTLQDELQLLRVQEAELQEELCSATQVCTHTVTGSGQKHSTCENSCRRTWLL